MPITQAAVFRRFLLPSLLISLLAVLPFLPGLPGEFTFDDIPNITTNQSLHLAELNLDALVRTALTPQPSGNTRGLSSLSFAIDYWRAGGPDPGTFKTTNLLIHALTTFALAWLLRNLLLVTGVSEARARWVAPALALAWAVHPLLVSSVLYTVQRLQTLGTLFLVLALLAYLQARRAQIAGRSGRTGLLGAVLLWVIAVSCKEDSAALPAHALALELTVLRFAAADTGLATRIRRGYLFAAAAGVALYLLVVIPHYWSWDTYGGRDFSTPERLLTQARVLAMYLWQIVLPLPSHMPFYYDWLQPSHGLLQPWTTLASILLIAGMLALAWHQRLKRPLLALGIFLFFGAHFITSNVIGLELAFEHRNHFALIGAVLAIGSLLAEASQRLRLRAAQQAAACCALLLVLGTATAQRAHSWSNNILISQVVTQQALPSGRAWTQLCASYFSDGGGAVPDNPNLDQAIEVCDAGISAAPQSLNSNTLLVVLRTLRGDADVAKDWHRLQKRIQTAYMTLDNARIHLILTFHARKGVKLDHQELLKTLSALKQRGALRPFDLTSIGYFVMNDLGEPDLAMPYFISAINGVSPLDPFPQHLSGELKAKGRPDLAKQIETLGLARMQQSMHTQGVKGSTP